MQWNNLLIRLSRQPLSCAVQLKMKSCIPYRNPKYVPPYNQADKRGVLISTFPSLLRSHKLTEPPLIYIAFWFRFTHITKINLFDFLLTLLLWSIHSVSKDYFVTSFQERYIFRQKPPIQCRSVFIKCVDIFGNFDRVDRFHAEPNWKCFFFDELLWPNFYS